MSVILFWYRDVENLMVVLSGSPGYRGMVGAGIFVTMGNFA